MKILSIPYKLLTFLLYYLFKVIQSNIYIAYDILTPKMHTNPGYVWVPIRINSKFGLLFLSNLISMTPGTLSIDYSEKKNALLVHYLYDSKEHIVLTDIERIQNKIIALFK
ncbi:MAG: Na+/H+ antiporter subunit E [Bacteroidales bacterium]|nr:Na+/H+ antiporter subunit E [Bacteroidales bacterium]